MNADIINYYHRAEQYEKVGYANIYYKYKPSTNMVHLNMASTNKKCDRALLWYTFYLNYQLYLQ